MPILKLRRLLLKCSVVPLKGRFDFLLRITPSLQKCPQILSCTVAEYLENRNTAFLRSP